MASLRHSGDSPDLPDFFRHKMLARMRAAARMRHNDGKPATRMSLPCAVDPSPAQRQHGDGGANAKGGSVKSRLAGALCRTALIVVVIATPLMVLADTPLNMRQSTFVAAMFCALVTFVEYKARAPSFVEFRDAPPMNRFRCLLLLTCLLGLSILVKQPSQPSELGALVTAIAATVGDSLDFPYSPIRLTLLVLDRSFFALLRR